MSAAARKPETLSPWTVGRPVSFDRSTRAPGDARLPSLSKERIGWQTNGDVVQIFVDLINTNDHATTPAFLFVEAAALGAFVQGWPVARIPVPAMSPGERLRVESSVARSALPSTDLARTARGGGFGPTFPPPGLDLLTPPEWVGNLNVWFDVAREQAVEVHRALDLRVAAGRPAAVGVYVPHNEAEFRLELECMGAGWTAEIVRVDPRFAAFVVVHTPVAGRRAVVNLWVTRLSDDRQVLVELAFRSVEGPSEQLGCVRV